VFEELFDGELDTALTSARALLQQAQDIYRHAKSLRLYLRNWVRLFLG
jgi:hypothetical protein